MSETTASPEKSLPSEDAVSDWRAVALFLYGLLDDIDTLDDSCRDNDAAFRDWARAKQQRRFEVSATDGCEVRFHDRGGDHE